MRVAVHSRNSNPKSTDDECLPSALARQNGLIEQERILSSS
jgi:hypothetical protein